MTQVDGPGSASAATFEPTGSLAKLLEHRADEDPEFPLVWVEDDGPWTFGNLANAAVRLHTDLAGAGLEPGDRVLVRIGNDERFLPALAASWALRALPIAMHPGVPAAEVARVVDSMGVRLIVASPDDGAVDHDGGVVVVRTPTVPRGVERRATRFVAPEGVGDDEPALVLLTSGSTGAPKGVMITHGSAWANVRATVSAFRSDTRPSPLPTRSRPPNIVANPLSHTGGIVRLLFAMYVGRGVVLLRKFQAAAAKRAIDRHGVDNLTINPAMIRILLEDLPPGANLGAVRYVSSGTAPLPDSLRERFEERYGIPVLQAYGQTEAFGAVTIESAKDVLSGRRRPGSVGRPLPGVELRIVDDDGRTDLERGEEGEVWVRTRSTMSGYVGDEASPIDAAGWLRTGDLGRLDEDSYLYITGRKKNIIISGGFNILPEELEAVLMADEDVSDVAVVAVLDERLGEIPVAMVEAARDGVHADAILTRIRAQVTPYKRPRRLFVVEALPRVPAGKVDRATAAVVAAKLCDAAP